MEQELKEKPTMHTGMPQLELNQNPGSEGCPDPEKVIR
jgi:hypothetical protein